MSTKRPRPLRSRVPSLVSTSRFIKTSVRACVIAWVLLVARKALRALLRRALFRRTLVRFFVAMIFPPAMILRTHEPRGHGLGPLTLPSPPVGERDHDNHRARATRVPSS